MVWLLAVGTWLEYFPDSSNPDHPDHDIYMQMESVQAEGIGAALRLHRKFNEAGVQAGAPPHATYSKYFEHETVA